MSSKLIVLLKIGVSFGLIYWLLQRTSWDELKLIWTQINWPFFSLGLFLYQLKAFVIVLRWRIIAEAQGRYNVSLKQYCRYYWIGMYFNAILPSSVGGDAVRAYYLARGWKRYAQAFVTVLIDRFFGLWILIIALGIEVILFDFPIIPSIIEFIGVGCAIGSLVVVVYLSRVLTYFKTISYFNISGMANWFEKSIGRAEVYLPVLAFALLSQFISLIIFILIGVSLGLDLEWTFVLLFLTVEAIVSAIPISIGGVGLREGVAIYFLSQVGLSTSIGLSYGFLFYVIVLLSALPGGIIYLFSPKYQKYGEDSLETLSRD